MNSIDAFASVPLTALDAVEGLVVPLDASISDPEALKTLRFLMQPPSDTPVAPSRVPLHETSTDLLLPESSEEGVPTPSLEESIPSKQQSEKPPVFAKSSSFESPPLVNLPASPALVLNALPQVKSPPVTAHGDAKEEEIEISSASLPTDLVLMEALRAFFAPAATSSQAVQPSVSPDTHEHFVSTRIADLVSALTTGNEEAIPVSLRPFVTPLREALVTAQEEGGLPLPTEPLKQIQALLEPLPQTGNISIPQSQKQLPAPLEALRLVIQEALPAMAKPVTSPVSEAFTVPPPEVTEPDSATSSKPATVEVEVRHPVFPEPPSLASVSKPLTNFPPTTPVISIPSTAVPLPTPEEVLRQTLQTGIAATSEPSLNTPSSITADPRPILATHSQLPEPSLPTQPVVQHQIPQAVVKTKTDAEAPAFSAPKPFAANSSAENTDTELLPIAEQPANEVPNLGQTILQSIGSQSQTSPAHAAPDVNASVNVERLEQVSTLMTEMADRVLVTDPLHQQTPEVRIKLADHVMPGTEVRVWREDSGQLRVEFDTSSGYWARVLTEASPLLSQRLNERLNLPEAVQVNVHQQGDQPEDGRSRNRHTPWDLARQADDQ